MSQAFDKVIKGGTVVDGQRTPRFVSDIGIRNGKIVYIGDIKDSGGGELIDARGLIVAPGFVDLHTHYDSQIFWDPYCSISSWHGVTSVVIGNCGFGFAPCRPEDRDRAMLTMSRNEAVPLETMKAGMPWDWETFPEFLDSIDRTPKGVNVLTYVPLNPLLMYTMGLEAAKSRPATPAERDHIRRLFNEALDAGACGFSAQLAGGNGGVQLDYDGTPMITDVMSHDDLMLFAEILRERQEGFIQVACTDLQLTEDVAEVSGRPVVWNTMSVMTDQHGVPTMSHRDAIKWLDRANARGLRIFGQSVTCEVGFTFTMEDWNLFDSSPLWREVTIGSREERLAKMADPAVRKSLRNEYDTGKGPTPGGGTEDVMPGRGIGELFVIGTQTEKFKGHTIGEVAESLGKHAVDTFLDLIIAEDLKTTFETPPFRTGNGEAKREATREVVRSPVAIPGVSDGGAHTKFITLGAYPTEFLTDLVRKDNLIDLEDAHWRLSGYPAYAAGLRDRGVIREGLPADIIIYDYDALGMLPTEIAHDYPAGEWRRVRRAEGYRFILVNGETTFVDGTCTGATPGQLLRHGYGASTRVVAASN